MDDKYYASRYVSGAELRYVMGRLGEPLTEEDVAEMIAVSGDGTRVYSTPDRIALLKGGLDIILGLILIYKLVFYLEKLHVS